MKLFVLISILFVAGVDCLGQPLEQRRFGVPTMWGPVHSVRVERADVTDANGQPVEGLRVLVQTINYNEDGTKKDVTTYGPNGAVSFRKIETFAVDGRILETVTFDSRGNELTRSVNQYDDSRRPLETVTRRPDGSVVNRITFTYTGNKRFHESISYDRNGIVISKTSGTLDMTNHQIQTIAQTPTQTTQRETGFTDLPNSQVYEEKVNGQPARRTLITNPTGRGPEMTQFSPDGTVESKVRSENEFDAHRNMIKSTSLREEPDGKFHPVQVIYRSIQYYEPKISNP